MVTRDKLYSCTQQSSSTIHRYRRLCRSSTTIRKSLELTKTIWGDKHLQYLCTIILWIEPYILLNIGNTNKQAIFQNRVKKVFIDIQARSLSPTDIAQEVDPDKFYMAIEKFLHLYLMDAPPQQEIQSLKEFISNLIKNDLTPNLGEEHPITIQYENDLAHILFLQGNYKEAILIKEKLLESSKKYMERLVAVISRHRNILFIQQRYFQQLYLL